MIATQQGSVVTRFVDGIATIEFEHPAHNSLPGRLLSELTQAVERAGDDEAVRVIVLQSHGDRTFCAGASFDELLAIQDLEAGRRFFSGFAQVINAMRRCPKFIIGRVQGKAIGGGVGLAAATDYCLATQYAAVKLSELAIGIGPFVVGPAVERKVGASAFQQLAINASNWQSARWACDKGLYNEVFDDIDALDGHVHVLATQLRDYSPEAMRRLKTVCWAGAEHWDALLSERAAISGELVLTDEARAAIQAIKAK